MSRFDHPGTFIDEFFGESEWKDNTNAEPVELSTMEYGYLFSFYGTPEEMEEIGVIVHDQEFKDSLNQEEVFLEPAIYLNEKSFYLLSPEDATSLHNLSTSGLFGRTWENTVPEHISIFSQENSYHVSQFHDIFDVKVAAILERINNNWND